MLTRSKNPRPVQATTFHARLPERRVAPSDARHSEADA